MGFKADRENSSGQHKGFKNGVINRNRLTEGLVEGSTGLFTKNLSKKKADKVSASI
jgi:hypothetical protein